MYETSKNKKKTKIIKPFLKRAKTFFLTILGHIGKIIIILKVSQDAEKSVAHHAVGQG